MALVLQPCPPTQRRLFLRQRPGPTRWASAAPLAEHVRPSAATDACGAPSATDDRRLEDSAEEATPAPKAESDDNYAALCLDLFEERCGAGAQTAVVEEPHEHAPDGLRRFMDHAEATVHNARARVAPWVGRVG